MPETNSHPREQPAGKTRRWKRTAAAALLLLAGGAVVNVAVAWGCAYFMHPLNATDVRTYSLEGIGLPEQRHWTVTRRESFGMTRVAAMTQTGAPTELNDPHEAIPYWSSLRSEVIIRAKDAERDSIDFPGPHAAVPVALVGGLWGWPFRSLRCLWDYGTTRRPPADGPLRSGIELSPFTPAVLPGHVLTDERRALPLRPIPPGFVFNTLFYALLLWLLFFTPFAARRMLRRRRGQCEKCAYPIGVSAVCTECGAAVSRNEPRA